MQDTYWWLHGKQGHDLQQVVLDDVSDNAILVKVAPSPLCAEVFTEDDLYISDEAAAPQGFKNQVGKSQHLQQCTFSNLFSYQAYGPKKAIIGPP